MSRWMPIALIIAMLLIPLAAVEPAGAQPTWSFDIRVQPAELYPGEWGALTLNITNMDCQSDLKISEFIHELEDVHEDVLEGILARADELNQSRQIEDFEWITESVKGYGGDLYYTGELKLYGVCTGRAITIKKSSLWFPFKGTTRTYIFENKTEIRLEAFDRVRYILEGSHPESSALIEFRVYVPPDIPPEDFEAAPNLDLRVDYPGWIEYTLQGLKISGVDQVKINPYRTFNLTVVDYDGVNPIAGAKVVVRRLIHYYEKREYVTPGNGTISVHRLREGDYEVRIYWNSSTYRQEKELVYVGQLSAYELSKGVVKTHVYNFRVGVADLKGRRVDGAIIILDGVEKRGSRGEAVFQLVPEGNHSLEIWFKGVNLYDGWVWAGYHPTYYPGSPSTRAMIKLNISDLLVQAVDDAGRPVGAVFSVEGPTAETTIPELYSPSGLLNLSQLPVAEYRVKALNYSKPFSKQIEGSGVFKPGRLNRLILPIYQVKLRILDAEGSPVEGALVTLASSTRKSGGDGLAVFEQVPRGSYNLTVRWLNVTVYSGGLSVDSAKELDVKADIYDINIEMRDLDGCQRRMHYILSDPAGRTFEKEYSAYISAERVPGGRCFLKILHPSKGWVILRGSYNCSELASKKELRLPLGRMKVKILSSDGKPLEFARVKIVFPEWDRSERLRADSLGEVEVADARLGTYRIQVVDSRTLDKVYDGRIEFEGKPITIRIRQRLTAVHQAGSEIRQLGSNPLVKAVLLLLPIAVPIACALILWRRRRARSWS